MRNIWIGIALSLAFASSAIGCAVKVKVTKYPLVEISARQYASNDQDNYPLALISIKREGYDTSYRIARVLGNNEYEIDGENVKSNFQYYDGIVSLVKYLEDNQ
jgi:hypothetical protein